MMVANEVKSTLLCNVVITEVVERAPFKSLVLQYYFRYSVRMDTLSVADVPTAFSHSPPSGFYLTPEMSAVSSCVSRIKLDIKVSPQSRGNEGWVRRCLRTIVAGRGRSALRHSVQSIHCPSIDRCWIVRYVGR